MSKKDVHKTEISGSNNTIGIVSTGDNNNLTATVTAITNSPLAPTDKEVPLQALD